MKLKLILVYTLVIALGLLGGIGTYAWFTSQASSTNNEFTAGTFLIKGNNTTEPVPLFKTEYEGDDSIYNVGFWYPGKEVLGKNARNYTLENDGTLTAKIAGISAQIVSIKKDDQEYLFKNFSEWPQDIVDAYNEFADKLFLVVTWEPADKKLEYFRGKLISLISGPQPLLCLQEPHIMTLGTNSSKTKNIKIGAYMSTEADNKAQGVSATVNIIIHATQDNDDAVNELLKVTP